jgi:hypothetical protein
VALAVMLVAFAILSTRTYQSLARIDKGFDTSGVAVVVWAPRTARATLGAEADQLVDRLRGRPEIEAISRSTQDPFSPGGAMPVAFQIDGRPSPERQTIILPIGVPPEYFSTMRLPMVSGRLFAANESPTSVIVSDAFSRRFWPDGQVVGSRFRLDAKEPWREVVGVVPHVRHSQDGIGTPYPAAYETYQPLSVSAPPRSALFVARLRSPEARRTIEAEIRAVDPRTALRIDWMDRVYERQISPQRNMMMIAGSLATIALVIAMAGLGAVLASLVTARTREIGIRMALGASRGRVAWLVLGSASRLTLAGLALGCIMAATASRWVSTLFYGVTTSDPLTYAAVGAMIALVATLATWTSVRRATRVDPATALRAE